MARKKNIIEKLRPIFTHYSQLMPSFINIAPKHFFPADYWAPLKLYCLASYIHTCYSKIISQQVTENFYFLDLMANSGINFVNRCEKCDKDKKLCSSCKNKNKPKYWIVGSTLIASTSDPPFKKIYFCDKDKTKVNTLEKRLDLVKKTTFPNIAYKRGVGDCNKLIDAILTDIKKTKSPRGRYHLLAFADNEGLNVTWDTIEKILGCYADLIINFPTSNIKRAFGQPSTYSTKSLDAFFGCKIKEIVSRHEDLLPFYLGKIQQTKSNVDVETIKINTGQSFNYDLIIVAKKGPYWNYIKSLKQDIEKNSAKTVEHIIPIIAGHQKTLFGDFPNKPTTST